MAVSCARYTALLVCLTFLHMMPCSCFAQSTADSTDNQTLRVQFISLKPGNAIARSLLTLQSDKGLSLSIEGTSLVNVQGRWSQAANSFSARVSFTVDKRPSFHYRLDFEGYRLNNLYGGRAYLNEFDHSERLIQKINFLFYAAPTDTLIGSGKDDS